VVEFTDWDGGFTDVSFLNTLTVDFEPAAEVNELVIYYPDTAPPLATVEGVTFTAFITGSRFAYETTSFQDVNALTVPTTTAGDPTKGAFYNATLPTDPAYLTSDQLTFEFWGRAGTSLPQVSTTDAICVAGLLSADFNSFIDVSIGAGQAAALRVNWGTEGGQAETRTVNLSTADGTSLNHVSLQRLSSRNYALHYKGQLVDSFTVPFDASVFAGGQVSFVVASSGIPGTALSQIRLTNTALYGTGNFTPPSTAFFTPPS
jgi:hypothetical protein